MSADVVDENLLKQLFRAKYVGLLFDNFPYLSKEEKLLLLVLAVQALESVRTRPPNHPLH
jgi:hypothetical protein